MPGLQFRQHTLLRSVLVFLVVAGGGTTGCGPSRAMVDMDTAAVHAWADCMLISPRGYRDADAVERAKAAGTYVTPRTDLQRIECVKERYLAIKDVAVLDPDYEEIVSKIDDAIVATRSARDEISRWDAHRKQVDAIGKIREPRFGGSRIVH